MLNLGVPESHLQSELGKLAVNHEFQLIVEPSSKQGIHGTKATVNAQEGQVQRHLSDVTEIIKQARFSQSIEDKSLAVFSRSQLPREKFIQSAQTKYTFTKLAQLIQLWT